MKRALDSLLFPALPQTLRGALVECFAKLHAEVFRLADLVAVEVGALPHVFQVRVQGGGELVVSRGVACRPLVARGKRKVEWKKAERSRWSARALTSGRV